MNKNIIYGTLVLALLVAGIGYYMYNKPVSKMASLSVDENVSAEELFSAYETDETAANIKYLDKVIEVTGEIVKVNRDAEKMTIFLDTGDMLANIMCQMEDINTTLPEVGSTISVKGLCTGYLTDVVLVRSVIID